MDGKVHKLEVQLKQARPERPGPEELPGEVDPVASADDGVSGSGAERRTRWVQGRPACRVIPGGDL